MTVQAAPLSVSLAVTPKTVVYGARVALTGTVSSHAANDKVTVEAQACGNSAAHPLATVTTTSGGAYMYTAQPLKNTTYTAKWKSVTSGAATAKVRPRLTLGRIAPHRYRVRVRAAQSFAGKTVAFLRWDASLSRWVTVKRVTLVAGPSAIAPTVVSQATFRARVRARMRVRAVLGAANAAPCYLAGVSTTILA